MYPRYHVIFGLIFSAILFLIFPEIGALGVFTIFLSSFLIDTDHYIYYAIKKRDPSLKNAYNWFVEKIEILLALPKKKRNRYFHGIYFFHGFEVLFVLLILGIVISPVFFFILTGFNFHLFLDAIEDNKYKINSGKYLMTLTIINSKKLKSLN